MRNWQKEAEELLKKFKNGLVEYWDEAMEFLLEYQSEVEDLGIVDDDCINEIVNEESNKWGWQRVACFLYGIQNAMNMDFYRIDGYGNAQAITSGDIDCWLSDIARNW